MDLDIRPSFAKAEEAPRPNSGVFAPGLLGDRRTFSCWQMGVVREYSGEGSRKKRRRIELDERNYRKKMNDCESSRSQGLKLIIRLNQLLDSVLVKYGKV